MNITLRLLLGYFLIVGLAAWFVMNIFSEQVKPGVRQTMEETLVDTAHLLAEIAATQAQHGKIDTLAFANAFQRYRERNPHAHIWGFEKNKLDLQIYITDAKGIVLFDSEGTAVGKNYARWNDVHLTLKGQYGVRSTQADPNDKRSTVMHVAAPIMHNGQILGVLTVAKPSLSVQPFIDRSREKIENYGWALMGGALFIGLLFTGWLTRSINQLRAYARDVSLGKKVDIPALGSGELAELGRALSEMRSKLDGREYVENYVHHLTHEMKSPLTALLGAAELLDEDMPAEQRAIFIQNIREQSSRLKDMLDKLLALAKLEQRNQLEDIRSINLQQLADTVINDFAVRCQQQQISCNNHIPAHAQVKGEFFLLRQALANLIDNALDFSPSHSHIDIRLESTSTQQHIIVSDSGTGIPDYAIPRIFERFYSLNRPNSARKSTGIGLPFVREVALLHGGEISLKNREQGGVEARLSLAI